MFLTAPTSCVHASSWTAHAQAEAQMYFSRELPCVQTKYGSMRIYTEENLHDEAIFRKVECFTRILEERLLEHSGPEQTFSEAVLELPLDAQENEKSCLYYLVDPYNRNVGWFEDYDGAEIAAYIAGVPSAEYLCTYVTSCR